MQFGVYVYKQYDTDILSLADAGYDISRLMKEAVCGYANNRPINFYIDRLVPFDVNGKKSIRVMLNVPKSDKKTIYMLQHIKDRYRGRFCKAVFRNALIQQNICCYFADENLMQLQTDNLSHVNLSAYINLKPISAYIKQQKLTVNNQTVVIDAKQEKTNFNGGAFANLSNDTEPVAKQKKQASVQASPQSHVSDNPQQGVPDLSAMMNNPQFMAQMMQMFASMQGAGGPSPTPVQNETVNASDPVISDLPQEDEDISLADNYDLLDAFSNI